MLGSILWGNFVETFDLPREGPELDEDLLAACSNALLRKKLDRSTANLLNNLERTSPDVPENSAKIFTKSQEKAKRSTVLSTTIDEEALEWWNSSETAQVKPGQTLALFPDQVLAKLGPVTRYVHAMFEKLLPGHVFLLGGHSPAQLDEWCRKNAKSGPVFTNDFTAYDQSCTGEALWFEINMMRWLSIPEEAIRYYWWLKVSLETTFGPSAVMRFTGEPGTYIFNTMYNLAYMALKYNIKGIPCVFSGDDSLLYAVLAENSDWFRYEHLFTLVGKAFISELPECCGWLCYPQGIVRDPLVLALKTLSRENVGELAKVLDSYFLESLFAYNQGDVLSDLLSPELLELHSWFINHCFKHSSIVKHISRTSRADLAAALLVQLEKTQTRKAKFRLTSLISSLPYIFGISVQSTAATENVELALLLDTGGGHVQRDSDHEEGLLLRGRSVPTPQQQGNPRLRRPQRGGLDNLALC
jgi:hypothetical protein